MQAFANEVSDKIGHSSSNEGVDINEATSLFSAGEIIFPGENTETISTRYGYSISGLNFLVPENTVSEVIQNPKIFSLPNSPYWVEGLINIRGNIIPVMNIDKFLKKTEITNMNNILVLDKSDDKSALAFLISDLPVSLELSNDESSTSEFPVELQGYISEGFNQNNVSWVEFSPQHLFKKLANNKQKL